MITDADANIFQENHSNTMTADALPSLKKSLFSKQSFFSKCLCIVINILLNNEW